MKEFQRNYFEQKQSEFNLLLFYTSFIEEIFEQAFSVFTKVAQQILKNVHDP